MAKLTKSSFAAAKRRLGIKKVTKKNIGRIAKAAMSGGKSRSRTTKRSKTKRKTTRKSNPKGGNRRMGKRFGVQQMISIAKKGALIAPAAEVLLHKEWDAKTKLGVGLARYTGFRVDLGTFEAHRLVEGWGPYVSVKAVEMGLRILGKIA